MNFSLRSIALLCCVPLTILLANLLAGCATKATPLTLYDFGTLPPLARGVKLAPLAMAEPIGSAFLDNPLMFYRLAYANDQQPKPFGESRWSIAPAQLLGQRFKARLGQAGSTVISADDGAINVPLLRLEADDFGQIFDRPNHSVGRVTLRAAVFNGRVLLAQKSFTQQRSATRADAAGGARALALATDAVISDVLDWLGTLSLPKR